MPQAVAAGRRRTVSLLQQHCAKRDSNAELAAVAAITYSDLLLGCPDGRETGSCITLQMKKEDLMAEVTIEVRPNGPYIVNGSIELRDANGNVLPTQTRTVLCRCGASTNKPFCDGTHSKVGFQAAARAVPESAESATSPNAGVHSDRRLIFGNVCVSPDNRDSRFRPVCSPPICGGFCFSGARFLRQMGWDIIGWSTRPDN